MGEFSRQMRCYETEIHFFLIKPERIGWLVFVLKKTVLPAQGVFPYNLGYSEIIGRKSKGYAQNLATWRACSCISCLVGVEA